MITNSLSDVRHRDVRHRGQTTPAIELAVIGSHF